MKKRHAILMLALLTVGMIIGGRPGRGPKESPARAKARHYYMAGAIADAQGKDAEAYEYFKKGFQADTTFGEAAYHYSIARIGNRQDSSMALPEIDLSLDRIRRFVDSNPAEHNEAVYYAYLVGLRGDMGEAARIYRRIDSIFPEKTRTLLMLAQAEMARQRYPEALEALERYEAIEGENPEISLRRIQLLYRTKDTVGALAASSRLIEKYPLEPRYLLLRGNLHEELRDTAAMMQDYRAAEKLDPESGIVKLTLADAALQRGDSAEYDRKTYEALLTEEYVFEEKIELLKQYLVRLMTDSADTRRGDHLFEALQQQYPHSSELLAIEGDYRMATDQEEKGIEAYSYAVDLDPENTQLWQRLMSSQLMADRPAQAMRTYRKAESRIRPDAQMKIIFAVIASQQDSLQTALAVVGETLDGIVGTDDPSKSLHTISPPPRPTEMELGQLLQLYTLAGDIYHKLKDDDRGQACYENAIYIDDRDPMTLNNYAYFLAETGRELDRAYEMSRVAVVATPENPTNLDTFAWILFKMGRNDEAIDSQEEAIRLAEEQETASSELYHHYAEMLSKAGREKESAKAAARAKELENKEKNKSE